MNTRHRQGLNRRPEARYQAGFSLMEAMISLALSTVVTSAMVLLMGNSMGTATRIIEMSQLSDELRNVTSMMSRDVRRANYNPNSLVCWGNPNCNIGTDVSVESSGGNDCLLYNLWREAPDGANLIGGGGFWLNANSGAIEMWTGEVAPSSCGGDGWVEVTDPGFVEITAFDIDDDAGSFCAELHGVQLRSRQVRMRIEGRLAIDSSVVREVEDTIKVRNEMVSGSALPGCA